MMNVHIPNYKVKTAVFSNTTLIGLRDILNEYLEKSEPGRRIIDIKYSASMAPKTSGYANNFKTTYVKEYSAMVIYAEEEKKDE